MMVGMSMTSFAEMTVRWAAKDIRPLMRPCIGLRPIHRRLYFRKTVVANLRALVAMLTSYVNCVRMIYQDPSWQPP
eukprot:scaffold210183_cov23-Prasinocladus_malaysianus.AAC.1